MTSFILNSESFIWILLFVVFLIKTIQKLSCLPKFSSNLSLIFRNLYIINKHPPLVPPLFSFIKSYSFYLESLPQIFLFFLLWQLQVLKFKSGVNKTKSRTKNLGFFFRLILSLIFSFQTLFYWFYFVSPFTGIHMYRYTYPHSELCFIILSHLIQVYKDTHTVNSLLNARN